jgi:N-carbamoylputrescine amidase
MPEAMRAPRVVTVAAVQMSCVSAVGPNVAAAEQAVRDAAGRGAQIVVLQELFASTYFCIEQVDSFELAEAAGAVDGVVAHFAAIAKELGVVIPVSYFERDG